MSVMSTLHVGATLKCSRAVQYMDEKDKEDIQYINFLLMARAGLRALEFYDPATQKHGQAHMQARYDFIFSYLSWLTHYYYLDWVSPST